MGFHNQVLRVTTIQPIARNDDSAVITPPVVNIGPGYSELLQQQPWRRLVETLNLNYISIYSFYNMYIIFL